jgi:ADP-heptose:LPS heptosyltransferase
VGTAVPETAPLLTHAVPPMDDAPAAEQALVVARLALRAAGAEPCETTETDARPFVSSQAAHAAAAELWRRLGLASRRVVALHPSAGAPLKSWPVERWARLADALVERGLSVLLVGAPTDRAVLERIGARMDHCASRLCGQSLDVSAAVYARCALLVCVDNGAGHLAAAVGTPTVRLYGPAAPAVFGPWPPRDDQQVLLAHGLACVPCGALEAPPCGAHAYPACLLALGVDDVLNAVWAQLSHG